MTMQIALTVSAVAVLPCQGCEHGPCRPDCPETERATLWPARQTPSAHELRSTLSMALRIMRDDLRSLLEVMADPARPAPWPLLATLDRDQLAIVLPILACIRRAEALIGRPEDFAPAWLDALIDGDDDGT